MSHQPCATCGAIVRDHDETDEPGTCHAHHPTGLWCRDGERGSFSKDSDRCKRCEAPAIEHWTRPPVSTRSGR